MLIVQFPQDDDFDQDVEFTRETEALLTTILEGAGLGRCDGFDIGSGSVNFFCTAADATLACTRLVEALQRQGLDEFIVAVDEGEALPLRVIWPLDHAGDFRIF